MAAASAGRYRLIRRLATGGMAEIYLADMEGEAGFQRRVIIKKILPHFANDSDFIRRLVDEGLLASRLTHGNIVQVLDLGRIGPDYFIAMEYVEGTDLRELLAMAEEGRRAVPQPIACRILRQVAAALTYAHEKRGADGEPLNIVHRDISPANIFISWEGVVKLGDFGIAKANRRLSGETMTGVLRGKFPYMSPEQTEGQLLTQSSDLFSLGTVAYELLAGSRPFAGNSEVQTLLAVREARCRPLAELRPEVEPELAAAIHRCLQHDPEKRFRRAAELERTLAGVMQRRGWLVTDGDLAGFLEGLFGPQRQNHIAGEPLPAQAGQVLEARPLDAAQLQALAPLPTSRQQRPGEKTQVAARPPRRSRRYRRALAAALIGLALAGAAAVGWQLWETGATREVQSGPSEPLPTGGEGGPVGTLTSVGSTGPLVAADQGSKERTAAGTVPTEKGPEQAGKGSAAVSAKTGKEGTPQPPPAVREILRREPAGSPLPTDGGSAGIAARSDGEVRPEILGQLRKEPDLDAEAGQPERIGKAERPATTEVAVLPAEADVTVDGHLLGRSPQRITTRPGGSAREITLTCPGYQPTTFALSYPGPRKVVKRLQPVVTAPVRLRYLPANAQLWIDGRPVQIPEGLNILETELPVGEHLVRVEAQGRVREERIVVTGEQGWRGTIAVEP